VESSQRLIDTLNLTERTVKLDARASRNSGSEFDDDRLPVKSRRYGTVTYVILIVIFIVLLALLVMMRRRRA